MATWAYRWARGGAVKAARGSWKLWGCVLGSGILLCGKKNGSPGLLVFSYCLGGQFEFQGGMGGQERCQREGVEVGLVVNYAGS